MELEPYFVRIEDVSMDCDGKVYLYLSKRTNPEFLVKALRLHIGRDISLNISPIPKLREEKIK